MPSPFDHIVVLDFEATCKPGAPPVPQEIIEYPSVLVSLRDRAVVDAFSSFVRPVHNPRLDPFCSELTSIQQADVDGSPPFLDVHAAHQAWLTGHGLLGPTADGRERFAFVTCGDWDLGTMLPAQCDAAGLPVTALPRAYRRWCNIKSIFGASFQRDKGFGMPTMLRSLGLALEGRHHRGIDDCQNIARIVLALAARGATIDITARLSASHYPELPLTLRWRDETRPAILKKRLVPSLLGLASGLFRTRISHVLTDTGDPLSDEALLDLPADATLHVVSPRDPS